MNRIPLIVRLVLGIALGIIVGLISKAVDVEWPIRIFATFNQVFGSFLSFVIPLIIFGFIAPGIGSLGKGAGKLLGISLATAYTSTVIAGLLSMIVSFSLFRFLLSGATGLMNTENPEDALVTSYTEFEIPPVLDVMTAMILAFVIGLGMTTLKNRTMYNLTDDFRTIIEKLLTAVVIPLLPFHVMGVFGNLTYAGVVANILTVFAKVFIMVLILHWVMLVLQYFIAGSVGRTNPFTMLKTMLPAYVTALGTQSSAASIPVTLRQSKKAGLHPRFADFLIPLNANIHLSGSVITITACSMAVWTLAHGDLPSIGQMIPVILVLGIMMVAAPGAPGGAVMTALGVLEAMMGFDQPMLTLMIALYLAQDSFGTAANVTGDTAVGRVVQGIAERMKGIHMPEADEDTDNVESTEYTEAADQAGRSAGKATPKE